MGRVTETLETHSTPVDPVHHGHRPHRLYRALAWVGIAAGSLFIVATVFFSGYLLGQHGDPGGRHGGHHLMLRPFPGPDGPMGPGPMGPGPMGPDNGPRSEGAAPPSALPGTTPRP